ncbi:MULTISPECIES: CBS domain-containing protein [Halomonas]|uniref:CBS domain-containing protein n=2 Tax=Halomonas TaxID=2745 RepID=A0A7X4VVU1_9GAMM|nr:MULTISPECIES: CBS domain-containing protein [Halomonas]MDR5900969.1 CBS domain-containing protein [Halomonas icarae]NAW11244.1 CBS domain-containing protein [Halomonas icarae]TDB05019.1 CBS domain-containing protein [Halomonas marinisediminis]
MQAADIMTRNVITVGRDSEVREIASLLLEHGISAVPVVSDSDEVLGIVSEGDLIRRVEDDKRKSWWLRLFAVNDPGEYVKSHGRRAHEIMTPDPLTIGEDMPLAQISRLLEKHHIKRVPVVSNGKLVGIVSRANLLQGFAVVGPETAATSADDREIREAIRKEIDQNTGVLVDRINVIVSQGQVELWGLVENDKERMAVQVAAENAAGVKEVKNNLGYVPRGFGGA